VQDSIQKHQINIAMLAILYCIYIQSKPCRLTDCVPCVQSQADAAAQHLYLCAHVGADLMDVNDQVTDEAQMTVC